MTPVFSSPVATIIHCGGSRIALGVFRLTGSKPYCVHFAEEKFPVPPAGEDPWLEHITAALPRLKAGSQWTGPAVLVLPAHLTLTKQIKAPRHLETTRRVKVIRFEAEQAIPHALTEMIWDCVVSGQKETEEDIMLVAARRDLIEQICLAARAAGFEPSRILPSALVTLAGFRLSSPAPAHPVLIVNIGGRSTIILQVDGDRFAARTLALGGASITGQVAEDQHCDPEEAERIKLTARNHGLLAGAREVFVTRLAEEIGRTVRHFVRESELASPRQVFLTGGGARLAGLDEALAARLNIPVEHFAAGNAVESGSGLAAQAVAAEALTDLIGAAAIVRQPDQPAVDLLPPALRRRASLRRRTPWWMAAALLAIAAGVPPIIHYRQVTAAAGAKITAMEKVLEPLRARDARFRANLAQLQQIKTCLTQLQAVHDRRAGWLQLFGNLQKRLGQVEDVWIDKFRTIPATEVAPMKLAVTGRMLDRANALGQDRVGMTGRVKALLAGLVDLPGVATVEGVRFDRGQPGILRFDFVLVADPAHPL